MRALFILLAVYGLGQVTNKTGRRSAKERQLGDMQIFGDSRLLMEWTRGGYNNQNPQLQDAIRTANEKAALPSYPFQCSHIYRENNTEADSLAKRAVEFQYGLLMMSEVVADEVSPLSPQQILD